MRVESITLRKLKMRLKAPFETSFGTTHDRPVLLVELQADGLTGWSEVTSTEGPFFNSESIDISWLVIREFLAPLVLGKSLSVASSARQYFAAIRGHEMARAGIENALCHVEAQQHSVPLWKLLGGTQQEIPCGVSLGLQSSPEELLERVATEVAAGYQRIKIKIKPGKDLDYIATVRKAFRDILLSVDANSSYTLNDTELLRSFDEFNLLMIEQPLWWDDIYLHSKLQKQLKTRLCLDESIRHLRDAQTAIELGGCGIVNIKLGRVGGHSSARDIQAHCLSKNIPVWCGGMLECGIGRAHNVAVSTLPGYTLPGDVSASARYWAEDVIEPEVTVTPQGTIRVPQTPGLGYHVRRDLIERWTVEKETFRT
jgi:o-succinylbenzoic acid (OSB) synthetase